MSMSFMKEHSESNHAFVRRMQREMSKLQPRTRAERNNLSIDITSVELYLYGQKIYLENYEDTARAEIRMEEIEQELAAAYNSYAGERSFDLVYDCNLIGQHIVEATVHAVNWAKYRMAHFFYHEGDRNHTAQDYREYSLKLRFWFEFNASKVEFNPFAYRAEEQLHAAWLAKNQEAHEAYLNSPEHAEREARMEKEREEIQEKLIAHEAKLPELVRTPNMAAILTWVSEQVQLADRSGVKANTQVNCLKLIEDLGVARNMYVDDSDLKEVKGPECLAIAMVGMATGAIPEQVADRLARKPHAGKQAFYILGQWLDMSYEWGCAHPALTYQIEKVLKTLAEQPEKELHGIPYFA